MSARTRLPGALTRATHSRLLVLVAVGAVTGVLGTGLAVAAPGHGTLGFRLAILGAFLFLVGGSGYVAFAVFERGFD